MGGCVCLEIKESSGRANLNDPHTPHPPAANGIYENPYAKCCCWERHGILPCRPHLKERSPGLWLIPTAPAVHSRDDPLHLHRKNVKEKRPQKNPKQNSFRLTVNSLEPVQGFIFNRGTLYFGLGEGRSGFALHVKPSNEQWSGSSARDPNHKQIAVNKFTIKEKRLAILPFAYRRRSFFIKVTNTMSEHWWGGSAAQKSRHLTCLVCVCVSVWVRLNIHFIEFGI